MVCKYMSVSGNCLHKKIFHTMFHPYKCNTPNECNLRDSNIKFDYEKKGE